MIYFVAPAASMFTMENYLQHPEAAGLDERIRMLTYEAIFTDPELCVGPYIFSGIDQLTPMGRDIVARCRAELVRAAPGSPVLNDPGRALTRYELLRTAFETGRNQFRAARASLLPHRHRFPVFVRSEREHTGSLTPLIESPSRLTRELFLLWLRGYRLRDLLIVEYCDTADADGIFRKYSAYVVGEQIIPRCLIHSRDWVTKDHDRLFNEQAMREEFDYVTGNPHDGWLRETFHLAGAEYGRIDYAMLAGRPQIWEINLAPTIGGSPPGRRNPNRTDAQRRLLAPAREHFYRQFRAALEGLDRGGDPSRTIRIAISASEGVQLQRQVRTMARVGARKTMIAQLVRPPVRLVKQLADRRQPRDQS